MTFMKSLPADAHAPHVFAKYPHIYKLYSMASLGIMRGPSPLSYGQRELLGAFVSAMNGCDYCMGSHTNTAKMFGIEDGLLEQLLENVDTADIDDTLKPLFRFIEKLTKTPTRMIDSDAAAVYAAGWNEDALHSAVAVSCTFQFMNNLIPGLGIDTSREDYKALGAERFGTSWRPTAPQDMPANTDDMAEFYREAFPKWDYEEDPTTKAATDALYGELTTD